MTTDKNLFRENTRLPTILNVWKGRREFQRKHNRGIKTAQTQLSVVRTRNL